MTSQSPRYSSYSENALTDVSGFSLFSESAFDGDLFMSAIAAIYRMKGEVFVGDGDSGLSVMDGDSFGKLYVKGEP